MLFIKFDFRSFIIRNSNLAIFIVGGSPTISNVTVVDNQFGAAAYAGATPDISNSIFWNNTDGDLFQCEARYSFLADANEQSGPMFADYGNGDYHLLSERGRYWPEHNVWVVDKAPVLMAATQRLIRARSRRQTAVALIWVLTAGRLTRV